MKFMGEKYLVIKGLYDFLLKMFALWFCRNMISNVMLSSTCKKKIAIAKEKQTNINYDDIYRESKGTRDFDLIFFVLFLLAC